MTEKRVRIFNTSDPASRDQQIVILYAGGVPMSELASKYGLSRQRTRQIIRRLGGVEAEAARAVRRGLRSEQHRAQVQAFLDQFHGVIVDLASSGSTRTDIEGRFSLLLPDVQAAVIQDSLTRADVIFDVNVQEYVFPTAAIEAAVWYVLACDLNLKADLISALRRIDLVEAQEVATVLGQQGLPAGARAEILTLVAAARAHAVDNPAVTIGKQRYDEIRRDILTALGLFSAQGVMPWPPTGQTVMKRLGGGYWAEALRYLGLTSSSRGRKRGLLRFSQDDYANAVVDFLAQAAVTGQATTFDAFGDWIDSEERAGRRRPSAPSIRLRYVTWYNAKRTVVAPGVRSPRSGQIQRSAIAAPSSIGALALHKAQDELRRFLLKLEPTTPSKTSAIAEEFIKGYSQEFEYSRRDWLRNAIALDPDSALRRREQGGLPRPQREALDQNPPNLTAGLSDVYLDRMLSGHDGGPRNTDSWLPSEAQAELDAIPDDVVVRIKVLRESRNYLTHSSAEARSRLQEALEMLAAQDSRFELRRPISRRVLLDWVTFEQAQRLRVIAGAVPRYLACHDRRGIRSAGSCGYSASSG
jgi:hypothetical protein